MLELDAEMIGLPLGRSCLTISRVFSMHYFHCLPGCRKLTAVDISDGWGDHSDTMHLDVQLLRRVGAVADSLSPPSVVSLRGRLWCQQ